MGEQPCPECGNSYDRLAQHWAMSSTCSAPPVPADTHYVLTGLALAGASIYGASGSQNPKFRAVTTVCERADWWDEMLGWLSTGLRDYRPERENSGVREPGYQVTTMAHEELHRYAWTLADGVPPLDISVPPLAARAWLSHAGSVAFSAPNGKARLAFSAKKSPERRQRIAAILRSLDLGIDPTVTDLTVLLSTDETERFQNYAAPPVPGTEHRWARTRNEYQALFGPEES